ncbi:unnamed protein product [Phyllotreta striolata]|uniref:Anaphase-promoting complex subunit 5 n=1 Tax=Phyllotreta striolata TaxID=444603 RepID=A0A9P0DID0_PHYSR|nr:unnamed protein product [Phyllotreta striolata]
MSSKDATNITKKATSETITPHKITVTILIRNFCLFREDDKFKEMDDLVLMCKYRRDFGVLILNLIQSPDIPLRKLKSLLASEKYTIPKSLVESLDQTLTTLNEDGVGNLSDIVDSLVKIMNRSDDHLNSTTISAIAKSSIVGYYLRRFILNFDKLTFSEVVKVYEDFQKYYEDFEKNFVNKEHNDNWVDISEQWSRRQAELFIATQATLLLNNENKALSPPDLQKRIGNILKSNPDLSGAHFIAYLNYLRVDEYCGAVDSLFHCFDRDVDPDVKCYNDEKSKRHRFAALNLAVLHYHFGHVEEALAALKESIQISQEANDNVCLQHALSWLYRMTGVDEDKLIVHCIVKSSELNLSYIASLGLQMLVGTFGQYRCFRTGKAYPIFETLAKSDVINCQHNYRDLMSNNYAMKASLWQLYGKTEVASLWSQLLLYQNMDGLGSNEAYYGEGFCLAICNIANRLLVEGDYALVNCILNFARIQFPHEPQRRVWQLCENIFVFTRALYHEKWSEAEAAAQKILVFDKCEGYLRLSEVYFYKRDFAEADNCVEMLLDRYSNENTSKFSDRYYYVRAKILKVEIQFAMNLPPPGIITTLNNCLFESQTSQLDYQTVLIHLHLANCMLHMGLTGRALAVLDKCLVQVLAHGGRYDRARATLLYAKCLVADSARLSKENRESTILKCARMLEKVKEDFRKIEAFYRVKDVLFLQARLYDFVNTKSERNRCALEYRLLDEEYTTKNIHTLVKYL